jgi:hypothetical protein
MFRLRREVAAVEGGRETGPDFKKDRRRSF